MGKESKGPFIGLDGKYYDSPEARDKADAIHVQLSSEKIIIKDDPSNNEKNEESNWKK